MTPPDLDTSTRARLEDIISRGDVTLFMKGDRQAPQCGFSATVVRLLDQLIPEYRTFDVLSDAQVRESIKIYSSWPTIPQLYVKGEFIGGCDIIQELFASGELHQTLGVDMGSGAAPTVTVTDAAAAALRTAMTNNGDGSQHLHLAIDARSQNSLFFGPEQEGEIAVEAGGISLRLDPLSAQRADGIVIDALDSPGGPAFRIDNPNAPKVAQLEVGEAKARLDAGEISEFLDVRTPEERARASIGGALLLTEEETRRIEGLPRSTPLLFHCHHGGRSQQAAEHFAALGFSQVFNLAGGIDAWSTEIDPTVPRY